MIQVGAYICTLVVETIYLFNLPFSSSVSFQSNHGLSNFTLVSVNHLILPDWEKIGLFQNTVVVFILKLVFPSTLF